VHPPTPAQRFPRTRLCIPSLAKKVAELSKRCFNHSVCKAGHHPIGHAVSHAPTLVKINVKKINV